MHYIIAFALLGYISKQCHYWKINKGIPQHNSYKLIFDLASWSIVPTSITLAAWSYLESIKSIHLEYLSVFVVGIASASLQGVLTGSTLEGFNEMSSENDSKKTNYTESDVNKIIEKELIEFINSGETIFIKTNENNIYTGAIVNVDFDPSIPFDEKYISLVPHYSIQRKLIQNQESKSELKTFSFNYIVHAEDLFSTFIKGIKEREELSEKEALAKTLKALSIYQSTAKITTLEEAFHIVRINSEEYSDKIFIKWQESTKVPIDSIKITSDLIKFFKDNYKAGLIMLATSLMPHKTMRLNNIQYVSKFNPHLFPEKS